MVAPNSYLLSADGEGARVYYVLASHAKTDTSYRNFQGLNYPFGEHLVYCDAQPIVANTYRFFVQLFPGLEQYAVGYQNGLSLYGLIAAVLLLYFVFLRWNLPAWYAAIAALVVLMIAPQVLRMPWQPGLAYAFVIPGFLLLYQSVTHNPSWKISGWIALINGVLFLVNPYLGAMASGFFLLTALFHWKEDKVARGSKAGKLGLQTLLPGSVYYLWVSMTDHHLDRVHIPTGFEQFVATPSTIFTSSKSFLKHFYEALGINSDGLLEHWEGWAYIGLASGTILISWIIWWSINWLRRKPLVVGFTRVQQKLGWISLVFLLFGMGIPFIWHDAIEQTLDLFPPLRQLRAFGRVTWVFAIVINCLIVYGCYLFIHKQASVKAKRFGYAFAVLLSLLTLSEGISIHDAVATEQLETNPFDRTQLAKSRYQYLIEPLDSIDFTKYSAIVPLPYYHVGSELFHPPTNASFHSILESMTLAYHAQKPLTGAFLSRLSRQESMQSLQFFGSNLMQRNIASAFPKDQPLLLLYAMQGHEISPGEKRLMQLGKPIFKNYWIYLIEVWPNQIWKNEASEFFTTFQEYKDMYTATGEAWIYPESPIIRKSYDTHQDANAFINGSYAMELEKSAVLFDTHLDGAVLDTGIHWMSYWFECGLNRPQAFLVREELDLQTEAVIARTELHNDKKSWDFKKGWMHCQTLVEISPDRRYRFRFEAPKNLKYLYVDELWIHRENQSVFVEGSPGQWLWNGIPLAL